MKLNKLEKPLLHLLLVGGICLMVWPAAEIVLGWWSQRQLHLKFKSAQAVEAANRLDVSAGRSRNVSSVSGKTRLTHTKQAVQKQRKSTRRWELTRIVAPEIGLDAIVVSGTDTAALKRGPGHQAGTALPGARGNCVIAAHRNMYGWWFYKLHELSAGSPVQLETSKKVFTYEVNGTTIVDEQETGLTRNVPEDEPVPRLTLYTCTMPKTDQRLLVTASLISTENKTTQAGH